MSLIIDGSILPETGECYFNTHPVEKILYNDVVVWENGHTMRDFKDCLMVSYSYSHLQYSTAINNFATCTGGDVDRTNVYLAYLTGNDEFGLPTYFKVADTNGILFGQSVGSSCGDKDYEHGDIKTCFSKNPNSINVWPFSKGQYNRMKVGIKRYPGNKRADGSVYDYNYSNISLFDTSKTNEYGLQIHQSAMEFGNEYGKCEYLTDKYPYIPNEAMEHRNDAIYPYFIFDMSDVGGNDKWMFEISCPTYKKQTLAWIIEYVKFYNV